MTQNAEQMLDAILTLPLDDRVWLVDEIRKTLPEEGHSVELSPVQLAEIERRIQAHESGKMQTRPVNAVLVELRARFSQ